MHTRIVESIDKVYQYSITVEWTANTMAKNDYRSLSTLLHGTVHILA